MTTPTPAPVTWILAADYIARERARGAAEYLARMRADTDPSG